MGNCDIWDLSREDCHVIPQYNTNINDEKYSSACRRCQNFNLSLGKILYLVFFSSWKSRLYTISTIFIGISKINQHYKATFWWYPGTKRNENSLKNATCREETVGACVLVTMGLITFINPFISSHLDLCNAARGEWEALRTFQMNL